MEYAGAGLSGWSDLRALRATRAEVDRLMGLFREAQARSISMH
jgi:hypothetical protein